MNRNVTFASACVLAICLSQACAARADDIPQPDQTGQVELRDPAVIAEGMEILNKTCGGYCHGTGGGGFKAPALRGRPDLKVASLHATISYGRKRAGRMMPSWKGVLTERQIWSVVAAIVSLRDAEPLGGGGAPSGAH